MTPSSRIPTASPFRWQALLGALAMLALGFTATPAHADEEVLVQKAVSTVSSRYGQTWQDVSITLLVKNLGYEKQVGVVMQQPDGTWTELEASYAGPAGSGSTGREYWKVTRMYASWGVDPQPTRDLVFAAKYTVNGQTYWDNNLGNNHHLGRNDGPYLRQTQVLVASSFWRDNGDLDIAIDVKNLDYTKNVTVVYSTDGWATVHEAPASYVPGYTSGYAYISSPNVQNVERWQAHIPGLTGNVVLYAVRYEVSGLTYWDNNHGVNYQHTRP
ncbi:endonuclease [Myxococcus sp. Y35]|uniref:endonuclease n=1 Tax=Pseudomyxococcus flavus TaxID=3115648 RepID=UPI003CEF867C